MRHGTSALRRVFLRVMIITLACGAITASADDKPARLSDLLPLPEWLSISGQSRVRFEALDEQVRAGRNGDDQIVAFRTNLLFEADFGSWDFAFEILDSRQAYGDEDSTPINTGEVNPFDVLQAYAQYTTEDFLLEDSISAFRAGRFTINIGSGRFVKRNVYRNTVNAFTGVDWNIERASGEKLRAFFTLPVNRFPNDIESLADNDTEGDDQDTEVKFWGLHYVLPTTALSNIQSNAELFYFGLNENDTNNRNTRNREIQTIGGRIYKSPQTNEFDFELETGIQFGKSRATSSPADRNDLDHFAQFYHAEVGYSFDYAWSPRLIAQFDFASGDDDPDDDENNRFDSLFSARRTDFGPLGIYGPFARSNLVTPGLRLQLKPLHNVSVFFAHRGYWLASDRDALVATGVRDASGDSGSFAGQQFETRVRWDRTQNLRLEAGFAYLFRGEFLEDAPNATDEGNPNFLYSSIVYKF